MSSSAAILSQVKSGEACHAFVGCAGKGGSTELEKRERAWIAQTTHSAFDCETGNELDPVFDQDMEQVCRNSV